MNANRWRLLADAVYEMNAAGDHSDFVGAVVASLSRAIPTDYCLVHVLDRARQKLAQRAFPENPYNDAEMAYYAAHPRGFPLVEYYETTGGAGARRLSEIVDKATFRRSDHYRHCLSRLGLDYHLALPVVIDAETVAGITLSRRRRDFTRQDSGFLDAFAPHFRLAWTRHRSPWTEPTDARPAVHDRLQGLGLTPRECDVLFWMMEGKQNREIAGILGRSLQTVQEHVANIVAKLGQANRHSATVFALRVVLSN